MAGPILIDGVAQWTATPGLTRPYVLGGAWAGAVPFQAAVADGDWFYAAISSGPRREFIQGRLVGDAIVTLAVLSSTNNNAPVTWPASGVRIITLQPFAAAYASSIADDIFWSSVELGATVDFGDLREQVVKATDMGDVSGILTDSPSDLIDVIDLGEGL